MRFRDLKKKLNGFGIKWDKARGKGSHGCFVGLALKSKIRRSFPIPHDQQKKTSNAYIKTLRRAFQLTEENGVSDTEFFG